MSDNLYQDAIKTWIAKKKVSGKVLDVGGAQLPISKRIQHEESTEFTILDLEVPHEEKAKVDIIQDLNLIIESARHSRTFDFAVCLEVSEYWWNPFTALTNIAEMLKQGGRLFISFHFIYPTHNPVNADMLRYTRMGAMKRLDLKSWRSSHGVELPVVTVRCSCVKKCVRPRGTISMMRLEF